MAQINSNTVDNAGVFRKKRAKKLSTFIDMTPMVDLMSLLITFFMLTTAFSKSKIMEIVLPDNGKSNSQAKAERTLNLLLSDNDKIFYYVGKPPENDIDVGKTLSLLYRTSYNKDGLRKTILNRNLLLYERIDSLSKNFSAGNTKLDKDSISSLIKYFKKKDDIGPIVMIKATKTAKYRNIVDVVDEMAICNVARYAIVEPNDFEIKMLKNAPQ